MLRNILKLNGVKELNKNTQSKVLGGHRLGGCQDDDPCNCDVSEPGVFIIMDC